jgi:hypothetical protein
MDDMMIAEAPGYSHQSGSLLEVESNTNDEQRRARGQRVTEVAWENAGSNRGLDLSLEKRIDG